MKVLPLTRRHMPADSVVSTQLSMMLPLLDDAAADEAAVPRPSFAMFARYDDADAARLRSAAQRRKASRDASALLLRASITAYCHAATATPSHFAMLMPPPPAPLPLRRFSARRGFRRFGHVSLFFAAPPRRRRHFSVCRLIYAVAASCRCWLLFRLLVPDFFFHAGFIFADCLLTTVSFAMLCAALVIIFAIC